MTTVLYLLKKGANPIITTMATLYSMAALLAKDILKLTN
jgi:hypothetical protein